MESLQETLRNLQHELNAKEEELESAKRVSVKFILQRNLCGKR